MVHLEINLKPTGSIHLLQGLHAPAGDARQRSGHSQAKVTHPLEVVHPDVCDTHAGGPSCQRSNTSPKRSLPSSARFDGRAVAYGFGELDALVPAYAATVHKSQGSEYPAIVIPVLTQHYPHVAAQPALHRRDARQAVGRAGRTEEGGGHRRRLII